MKYVLFYESAPDVAQTAPLHIAEHRARWNTYVDRGTLLLVGPLTDGSGAMAVFTTRADAEEFAVADPFVLHGVVTGWSIKEWHEVLYHP